MLCWAPAAFSTATRPRARRAPPGCPRRPSVGSAGSLFWQPARRKGQEKYLGQEKQKIWRASRDRGFDAAAFAVVVQPADLDLVAPGAALDAEREHRIARHPLADLAVDHRLAVQLHGHVLDEMHRHDPALRVLALAGLHRMGHQDANLGESAGERRANL